MAGTSSGRSVTGFQRKYSDAAILRILERVAEGETLSEVCRGKGMPDRKTVRRAIMRNEKLKLAYDAAREMQAHSLFEEALGLGRQLSAGSHENADVQARRVAIDTLKWGASKLLPREYGERADPRGVINVQINTGLDLGRGQRPDPLGSNLYNLQASIEVPEAADADSQRAPGLCAPTDDARPPRKHPFAGLLQAPAAEQTAPAGADQQTGAASAEDESGEAAQG